MFSTLDKIIESDEAILASNTSSVPIMRLAMATARPARVLGMHFFNPVQVRPLVELVSSLLTSEETATMAQSFVVERLHKRVITSKDRAGFVVNALLVPYPCCPPSGCSNRASPPHRTSMTEWSRVARIQWGLLRSWT